MPMLPFRGGRRRRGNPPTMCVCPKCGYRAQKTAGEPCRDLVCPTCGVPLMGE